MRILVVEDNELHRTSAVETLAGHEVTIAKSYDEALELMQELTDQENVERLLTAAGISTTMRDSEDQAQRSAYRAARSEAEAKSAVPFPFEVVLTDMMMPMSKRTITREVFNPSEQVPYGFPLALRAALRGAKYVAMVTDTNHHLGAMSASLDWLKIGPSDNRTFYKPKFTINGAKVAFIHAPFVEDVTKDTPCHWCHKNPGVCKDCEGTGFDWRDGRKCVMCTDNVGRCRNCKGTAKYDKSVFERKDWGEVLANLIASDDAQQAPPTEGE